MTCKSAWLALTRRSRLAGVGLYLAIVLLVAYVGDNIYSSIVPNTGAGITDYKEPGSSVESQRSISVDGPGNLMHTI